MGFIDNEKWKEERLKRMDGALAEIETASGAFDELHDVADALENLGEGMDPGWMGYIFKTLGLRLRELAYIGDEIKELVNKGLTVPKDGESKFIDGALTPNEWRRTMGLEPIPEGGKLDEGAGDTMIYDSHMSGKDLTAMLTGKTGK